MTEKPVADALEQAVGRESPPDDFSLVFHDDQDGNVIFLSQIESRIRLGMKKTWSSAIGMIFSDQA